MRTVDVAYWLLQAPSKQNKVYCAAAWKDPSTGKPRLYTAYGAQGRLDNETLTVTWEQSPDRRKLPPVPETVSGVVAAFCEKYDVKRHATRQPNAKSTAVDYSTVLAGPLVVNVPAVEVDDPTNLMKTFYRRHAVKVDPSAWMPTPEGAARFALLNQPAFAPRPPAARPTAAASVPAGIPMPDGTTYYPRSLGGMLDVDVLRQVRSARGHIGLFGATGSGKSTLPVAAFGAEAITHQLNGDTRVSDLVGKWVPAGPAETSDSGYVWRDGLLTTAMKRGVPYVPEEITRASAEVIAVLLSATDFHRTVHIDDKPGESVTAADGFTVVATWNPDGIGVNALDSALLRRFILKIEVPNDYDVAARRGVNADLVKIGKNLATKNTQSLRNGGFGNWVPPVATLLDVQALYDSGMGQEIALGALVADVPEDDIDVVYEVVRNVLGVEPVALTLGIAV